MPRKGPAYIQAPVSDETFAEYNAHRKGLKQNWLEYLLAALAEYKAAHPAPDAPPSEGPTVTDSLTPEVVEAQRVLQDISTSLTLEPPPDAPPSEGPTGEQPGTEAAKKHKPKKGGQ